MLKQESSFPISLFLQFVCIGFFLFHVVHSEIPLGSILSVEENDSWVSPNGNFAIGFFNSSDQPNQYSLGIRFNSESIPGSKQTVVWVAGADVTVGNKSYLQLLKNGELVLVDSLKGVTVWSSKTSQSAVVVSALLRDDGNFVLLDAMGGAVWQSFDNPTDTLLPGQNFTVYRTLRAASKTSTSSYYSLYMNASGQLQLRWESNVMYWTSGNPSASNVSAVFTSNGVLQLVNYTLKPIWAVYGEDHNDTVNFRLLRLDVDGNLRMYSWIDALKSWKSVWQAVDNQCNVFATCGLHGVCVLNALGSAECQCPLKKTADPNSKCFEQDCTSGFNINEYKHTFLYGIYPPSNSVVLTSLQQCKTLCMRNPNCKAATFTNDGTARCQMKTTPYLSGYSGPSISAISFIKLCADPLAVNPNVDTFSSVSSPAKHSYRLCIPCLAGAASGTFVLFAVVHLVLGCYFYRRRNMIWKKAAIACMGSNSKGVMMLSFAEIKDITGNFKHQIGAKMYRGVLPNHQPVAIKDVETTVAERKFRAAVSKIGSIHHKNLVRLHGYCCESGQRILVFEYIKHGSVEKYLVDDELGKRLTWRRRVDICVGVARAISYLHTECREFITHGNLKWENVVLDKNFEAKVSEFGLEKIHSEASSLQEKDVEDFGKMILILVTGCCRVEDICEWTYKEWIEGCPEGTVDKRMDDEIGSEELERILRIAFWCLQRDKRLRPSMNEVVKVLEGTLTVDPPPPPFGGQSSQVEEESSEL